MKISLVEYDAGNLPSVERALARQGVETERAATPGAIAAPQLPSPSPNRSAVVIGSATYRCA